MNRHLAIAAAGFGLALLCTSQSWAGSTSNGWSQRPTAAGVPAEGARTQYVFCFGGNPYTIYFSPVFTTASSSDIPNLSVAYGRYLTQTGYKANGGQCIHSDTSADASAEKLRRENGFRPGRKIIETSWSGS